MDYEMTIDAVREAISEPVLSSEEQIERKCDGIIRELDELCKLATNPETIDLVDGQKMAVGQMLVRSQLILSFLLEKRQRPGLRIVQNG